MNPKLRSQLNNLTMDLRNLEVEARVVRDERLARLVEKYERRLPEEYKAPDSGVENLNSEDPDVKGVAVAAIKFRTRLAEIKARADAYEEEKIAADAANGITGPTGPTGPTEPV